MISSVAGQRSEGSFKRANWWRYKDDAEAVESLHRDSRRCNAGRFGRRFKSVYGRKTCITSNGGSSSWQEKGYDRIWVGVQGKESICVVTLKQDEDPTHAPFYHNMCSFAQAIISEVECIPYADENSESFCRGTERPFSVVFVNPFDQGSDHEASSANLDEEKTIYFLKDKMESNLAFTFEETVETAIAAFQHLCCKELKAEDIWVSTTWNLEGGSLDMNLPERKQYLDIISGVSSGEGRLPKVPPTRPGPPTGEPFGNGLFVTNVTPAFNFLGAYNHLTYSEERPCSTRGGGCCSSSDEEDNTGGLFRYHKKSTVPNTGGSQAPVCR